VVQDAGIEGDEIEHRREKCREEEIAMKGKGNAGLFHFVYRLFLSCPLAFVIARLFLDPPEDKQEKPGRIHGPASKRRLCTNYAAAQ
jgi:hypothetical protein